MTSPSQDGNAVEYGILGPLRVTRGGRALDVGGPKQRAVLTVLLLSANRVVSLDRLIDELWGEEPPAQATGSLQAYVSNLRRILEPDRLPRQPPRTLVTQPPGYRLFVEAGATDAARFEQAAAEGSRLLLAGRPGPARARLEAGMALWRGRALADFEFERFAQAEATRLEELRLTALEDRLQADLALGSHATVVAEAEAAVGANPLRERGWWLLMAGLYRSGRQAEALRAYQGARRVLAEELGIEPGPGLRRLEADILAQAPSLDWRPPEADSQLAVGVHPIVTATAPVAQASGPATTPPVAPTDSQPPGFPGPARTHRRLPRPQLLGRHDELAVLAAALAEAGGGHGRAVLVDGEPGIGKTALVDEAVARAAGKGHRVARGGGVEGGATPAFWPWVEVVRSLLTDDDPDELRRAVGPGAADLAQVVPEVKEITGPLESPPLVDSETARVRLFEAVVGFLSALSRRRPLVVALDDLQWADAASLQLMGFLGARLASAGFLLVGTYRPAEIVPGHPLHDVLAALARHQVVTRVHLEGLGPDEVALLLTGATGGPAPDAVVAAVVARTEGNPFFVAELARLLASEGDHAAVVPTGVRDVLRRRLARLPDQAGALLSMAAVIGRDFELDILETVAGFDPERTLELLEAALMTGLVVEHPEAVGRFRFSHDLVREAILSELSALRRARLHARIGDAIERCAPRDKGRPIQLAHHFFHAAPVIGPDRAITYGLTAAEAAAAGLAFEQAESLLRRTLEMVGRLPAGDDRDRRELEVRLRLVVLVMAAEGYTGPRVAGLLAAAQSLGLRLGESAELGRLLFGQMTFQLVGAHHAAARDAADQLLGLAEAAEHPAHVAIAHFGVGVTALHQGEIPLALEHLDEARESAGLLDPDLSIWSPLHPRVGTAAFLAWGLWLAGDCVGARELADQAVAQASAAGDFSTAHALLFRSWIAVLDDDVPSALRLADTMVERACVAGVVLYPPMGTVVRGWCRAAAGDAAGGVAEIAGALSTLEAMGAHVTRTFDLALLADGQRRMGSIVDALATVERAMEFARRTGQRYHEAELHRLRGELLADLSRDRWKEADEELRTAVSVARAQGAASFEARAEASRLRLTARAG